MQNVKGAYDFYGSKQKLRLNVQDTLRNVFELYDCEPMDSTIINELELLTSKYAGGDEILKEMYTFTDQGGRQLGLRYDLTIPFAKVIALNPAIELPYKRYEIGKVFRDGPTKRGRLREFLQCDVDVVGIAGQAAEAELLLLATDVFNRLDIEIKIRWNNRRFLGELLQSIGVDELDLLTVMLTLDKKEKIGNDNVIAELIDKGLPIKTIEQISSLLTMKDISFINVCSRYNLENSKGAQEVATLQTLLDDLQLSKVCQFDLFISRGLSFYTGTVYEIFDATGSFSSSLGAGGRYDNIIGKLIEQEDRIPTVGISFGMESIMAILEQRNVNMCQTVVTIVPIGDTISTALNTATLLRLSNIRTKVDMSKRKLRKLLTSLASKGGRYVIFIGEEEVNANTIKLKNLEQGKEYIVTVAEAINIIKDYK